MCGEEGGTRDDKNPKLFFRALPPRLSTEKIIIILYTTNFRSRRRHHLPPPCLPAPLAPAHLSGRASGSQKANAPRDTRHRLWPSTRPERKPGHQICRQFAD